MNFVREIPWPASPVDNSARYMYCRERVTRLAHRHGKPLSSLVWLLLRREMGKGDREGGKGGIDIGPPRAVRSSTMLTDLGFV